MVSGGQTRIPQSSEKYLQLINNSYQSGEETTMQQLNQSLAPNYTEVLPVLAIENFVKRTSELQNFYLPNFFSRNTIL